MEGSMMSASIIIQPPSQAKTSQILYPPIMIKHSSPAEPGAQHFATAVLLDHDGKIVDGHLEGTKAATGFQVTEPTSASSTFIYAFSSLSITMAGSYNIRFDLYKVLAGSRTAGATLVRQLQSIKVMVSDGEIPYRRLSFTEQDFMRKAKDAGIQLP